MTGLPHQGALPLPFDRGRADRTFAELTAKGAQVPAAAVPLLEAAFGNSPFLSRLALRESEFLRRMLERSTRDVLNVVLTDVRRAAFASSVAEAMSSLRKAKRQAALTIALADISGEFAVADVTGALSDFADACVQSALRFLLKDAATSTDLAGLVPEEIEAQSGLIVLAMGKHGARELNYSSDIDLVAFYDSERFPFRKRGDARAAAVDLVKGLVKLLSEITADGYVFRVDLRLRPDAGATQIAISTEAAESYYETLGQNWERAAMIKARPCACDPAAAAQFLKAIEPFVWRRNLDYAAIEDIHSIKRQIHAHEGHGEIAVAGHNVKLGRGGIREIEFFVQTQQLILGGRDTRLRERGTLAALEALRRRGLVTDSAATELAEAYGFLRHLEHRLQMIDDEQTHTIPDSAEGLAHIAYFTGFASVADFSAGVRRRLETVQGHYVRLFERSPALSGGSGSLVFTGVEDDPETLATLEQFGFRDARHVAHAIRGWHHGRIRATRSPRARELLTRLVPPLMARLAATADPDAAFAQFDKFLTRLPAGVSLFSMLLSNPQLLKLIADICGSAPRFSDYLSSSPKMLDVLLDPALLNSARTPELLRQALSEQMAVAADYEARLDAARRFVKEETFRIGAQIIDGSLAPGDAALPFTWIAEAVVAALAEATEASLAEQAGRIAGGSYVILALGRLGGREMTATSDLDLVFIYDAPDLSANSDGGKPLPVPVYYGRLAQRLIAGLTAPTSEGRLYDVDMRLRPSGNKGPVAVSLESFARYHESDAWTWERMALTRARVVHGDPVLAGKVAKVIERTLTTPRDADVLRRDVREMREKVAAEFPARGPWDLKYAPGGLVDIEFAAQYLELREAPAAPAILDANTVGALARLAEGSAALGPQARALSQAAALQQGLQQVLRIAVDGAFDPPSATPGLKTLLARSAGVETFDRVEANLALAQRAARAVFEELLCD